MGIPKGSRTLAETLAELERGFGFTNTDQNLEVGQVMVDGLEEIGDRQPTQLELNTLVDRVREARAQEGEA